MQGLFNSHRLKGCQGFSKMMTWLFLAAIMALVFSSCAGLTSKPDPAEYRNGQSASEPHAKADALTERKCLYTYPRYEPQLVKHSHRRFKALEGKFSDSYILGYKSGYRRYFIRYMDLYCGD